MASAPPKRHHYVPQVFLRPWANEHARTAWRRRGWDTHKVSGIGNVALETGFHGSGDEATARESFFSAMEGEWPDLRRSLIDSRAQISPSRTRVAQFIAYLKLRTREERARAQFHETATAAIDVRPVTTEAMADFLRRRWGVDDPSEAEARCARDLVNHYIYLSDRAPASPPLDPATISQFVDALTDRILGLDWRIEHSSSAPLLTSDTPVVLWRPRSDRDSFMGYGWDDAREIWLPLDPQHLLVLAPKSGKRGLWSVGNRRIHSVNGEIASRCFEFVIGHPCDSLYLDSLPLKQRRPALRFNIRKAYRADAAGEPQRTEEILHAWVPPHDGVP